MFWGIELNVFDDLESQRLGAGVNHIYGSRSSKAGQN